MGNLEGCIGLVTFVSHYQVFLSYEWVVIQSDLEITKYYSFNSFSLKKKEKKVISKKYIRNILTLIMNNHVLGKGSFIKTLTKNIRIIINLICGSKSYILYTCTHNMASKTQLTSSQCGI